MSAVLKVCFLIIAFFSTKDVALINYLLTWPQTGIRFPKPFFVQFVPKLRVFGIGSCRKSQASHGCNSMQRQRMKQHEGNNGGDFFIYSLIFFYYVNVYCIRISSPAAPLQ